MLIMQKSSDVEASQGKRGVYGGEREVSIHIGIPFFHPNTYPNG